MTHYRRLFLSALLLVSVEAIILPKYFHICRADDPALGQCISDAANIVINKLVKGNKYFDLPYLSEFKIANITSPIDSPFKFELVDGIAGKLEDIRYIFSKFDSLTKAAEATAFFPELQLKGRYELAGKFHGLSIRGSGLTVATFKDVYCKLFWKMATVVRQGVFYVNVESLFVEYDIKDATFAFSTLSHNDLLLGEEATQHLNTHWQTLAKIIAPVLMQNFSNVALRIGRAVTPKVPLKDILNYKE